MLQWGCAPPDPSETRAENTFLLVNPPRGYTWTIPGQSSTGGTTVVGFTGATTGNALRVYRWSAEGSDRGGMTWLQPPGVDPTGPCNVLTVGLSADGRAVLGTTYHEPRNTLFLWTAADGMTDLGEIPGQNARDLRLRISRDGRVVMAAGDGQVFRWTRAEGRIPLATLAGDVASDATSMSADGRVIAGDARRADGSSRVFRWSAATGLRAIDPVPGTSFCHTFGQLSDDGKVLFGSCVRDAGQISAPELMATGDGTAAPVETLFRWTESGGTELIAIPAGFASAHPWGATSDGDTLVGMLDAAPAEATVSAASASLFRWTKSAGLVALVPPRGFSDCSSPQAMSADGAVVVATCRCGAASTAVKWDAQGRAVPLDRPAGFAESHPTSVSGDGHLVAGFVRQRAGTTEKDAIDVAVVWDDQGSSDLSAGSTGSARAQRVEDLVRAKEIPTANVDVGHLRMSSAEAAADGHTLFGQAVDGYGHPVTWIARWP